MAPGAEWGPCRVVEHLHTPARWTAAGGAPNAHSHLVSIQPLAVGDTVIVSAVDGEPDSWIVMGRLEPV